MTEIRRNRAKLKNQNEDIFRNDEDEECAMKFSDATLSSLDTKYKDILACPNSSSHPLWSLRKKQKQKKTLSTCMEEQQKSIPWFGFRGLQPAEQEHIAPNGGITHQEPCNNNLEVFVGFLHLCSQHGRGAWLANQ